MKVKQINMDRVERELAQTKRIIDDLVRHQPKSRPSVVRRTEENLARLKRSLAKSARCHAEMDRKLKRLGRYLERRHSVQRPAQASGNRKLHGRGAR